MIPKRIFYIWLGSHEPKNVKDTILEWKKIVPEYEIIGINNKNCLFNFAKEIKQCLWFNTIYKKQLWAFVSDYIRLKIIYDYGGIYLDTDISILKSFNTLLGNDFFAGMEDNNLVNLSVFGSKKNHPFIKDILNFYKKDIWHSTLYTIPEITTYILKNKYKYNFSKNHIPFNRKGIMIYPKNYFYPFHYTESFNDKCITVNTYTIHWWKNSWSSDENIRWLSSKHLLHKTKDLQNITINFYIQNTEKIIKKIISIFGFNIITIYKTGRFYLIDIFKLNIFSIELLGKKINIYLFSKIYLGSKLIK